MGKKAGEIAYHYGMFKNRQSGTVFLLFSFLFFTSAVLGKQVEGIRQSMEGRDFRLLVLHAGAAELNQLEEESASRIRFSQVAPYALLFEADPGKSALPVDTAALVQDWKSGSGPSRETVPVSTLYLAKTDGPVSLELIQPSYSESTGTLSFSIAGSAFENRTSLPENFENLTLLVRFHQSAPAVKTQSRLAPQLPDIATSFQTQTAGDRQTVPKTPSDALNVRLSLDSLSFTTRDDEQKIKYSIEIANRNRSRRANTFRFWQDLDEKADRFTGERVSSNDLEFSNDFDVRQIYKNLAYTNHVSFERKRTGDIFNKRQDIHVGPAGLKLMLLQHSRVPELSLSYIPAFNYLRFDLADLRGQENTPGTGTQRSLSSLIDVNVRANVIPDKVTFTGRSMMRFIHLFDEDLEGLNDKSANVRLRLDFQMFRQFRAQFSYRVEYDTRQERIYKRSNTETTTTFGVSCNFSLFDF